MHTQSSSGPDTAQYAVAIYQGPPTGRGGSRKPPKYFGNVHLSNLLTALITLAFVIKLVHEVYHVSKPLSRQLLSVDILLLTIVFGALQFYIILAFGKFGSPAWDLLCFYGPQMITFLLWYPLRHLRNCLPGELRETWLCMFAHRFGNACYSMNWDIWTAEIISHAIITLLYSRFSLDWTNATNLRETWAGLQNLIYGTSPLKNPTTSSLQIWTSLLNLHLTIIFVVLAALFWKIWLLSEYVDSHGYRITIQEPQDHKPRGRRTRRSVLTISRRRMMDSISTQDSSDKEDTTDFPLDNGQVSGAETHSIASEGESESINSHSKPAATGQIQAPVRDTRDVRTHAQRQGKNHKKTLSKGTQGTIHTDQSNMLAGNPFALLADRQKRASKGSRKAKGNADGRSHGLDQAEQTPTAQVVQGGDDEGWTRVENKRRLQGRSSSLD